MRSYLQFQKNQAQVHARKRTEHLKDIRQDPSGAWSYEGKWMVCTLPDGRRRRVTVFLWGLLALAACCIILCGCLQGTGMEGCFYVLLPYASGVFALCFSIRHLLAVTSGKGRMWEYQYEKHVPGLSVSLAWGFLSCLLCVSGRIAEAAGSGGWESAGMMGAAKSGPVFLGLQAATAVLFLAGFFLQKKLTWELSESE